MKAIKYIFSFVLLFFWKVVIFAQCPMCSMSVENSVYRKGINLGILYLLALPFLLMGGVIGYWYYNKKKFNSSEKNSLFDEINYN